MMPLDTVSNDNVLNNPDQIRQRLQKMKDGGVDGYALFLCAQLVGQETNHTTNEGSWWMCGGDWWSVIHLRSTTGVHILNCLEQMTTTS